MKLPALRQLSNRLARRASATACTLLAVSALATDQATAQVQTGIDVLAAEDCARLRGRKLGIITNHTGRTIDGRRTVDVLANAKGVEVVTLFSPEHGWDGILDEKVGDSRDRATGLRVFSLYGKHRTPTPESLQGVDTLVFDIQDIGCRFYTYVSTMRNALEAAAKHDLRFVVLDRPNPIGGIAIAGPVLADDRRSFIAAHRVPLRHGMTAGELARMIAGEDGIQAELEVVQCTGWHRADLWDRTGLLWVNPSPNMRCLTQALLYPGIGLVEGTNVSVGRGTDTPFEVVGAPWIDGRELAAELRAQNLPGVTFVPIRFTPNSSKHKGTKCGGVDIAITNWRAFQPVRTGIHLLCALRKLYRDDWDTKRLDWLLRDADAASAILAGKAAEEIIASWRSDLRVFQMRRKPFLLYE
ncbi:MAG: DUF1343 domain-containing protein [bacterium]|nr:DUF1343 domain-containing protein [bacterium]